MIQRLNFRNPNRGRQPRANPFLRAWRLARRKRVAYARAQVADTMKALQRQIARYEALATIYDVPVARVGPLPVIPLMPGVEWVELRQAMGELKQPVKPAPVTIGQPETATS
jgi:hypothetical protein